MKIFFAGPLTDLKNPTETKTLYQKMASVAKSLGFTYFWAFLNGTDPVANPDVLPQDVYTRDIQALDTSDIVVAYLDEPSTGTGIEIEHANKTKKPVVILYSQGKPISRMLRGCPAVKKEIVFSSHEDALTQLHDYLTSLQSR